MSENRSFDINMIDLEKILNCLLKTKSIMLVLIFSGFLSIVFLEPDYYLFAWFGFVPMLFAIENASLFKTYCLGLLAGVFTFSSGMYWIVDFMQISKGFELPKSLGLAALYWFYCGHLLAFLFLVFQWLRRRTGFNELVIFPVVVTTFTSAFPMLFPMRLGDSQTGFHIALQAIEFVGVQGLDAMIALVNIVIFACLRKVLRANPAVENVSKTSLIIALVLVFLWFGYGVREYSWWNAEVAQWRTTKVGIVQPNEIPRIGKRIHYPGYSVAYPPEMEMTERLSSLGASIVVWPEAQSKQYLDDHKVSAAFSAQIEKMGSSLIFQDVKRNRNPLNAKTESQFSAAIMLSDQGEQIGFYQKIKLIPFGEYLPLVTEGSVVKTWLKIFFGEFFVELSPGNKHKTFIHSQLNIIPLICYETTFPHFVAEAVNITSSLTNTLNGTVLVALTNDGWFGSTHQPYQHIMPSILRAVENRLPLIHVANNGPSIVVTPSGKLIFVSDFQRAGGYIVDVPTSSVAQGSFYSKHPRLFDNIVYGLFCLMLLFSLIICVSGGRKNTTELN